MIWDTGEFALALGGVGLIIVGIIIMAKVKTGLDALGFIMSIGGIFCIIMSVWTACLRNDYLDAKEDLTRLYPDVEFTSIDVDGDHVEWIDERGRECQGDLYYSDLEDRYAILEPQCPDGRIPGEYELEPG